MRTLLIAVIGLIGTSAPGARPRAADAPIPAAMTALLDCQKIAAPAARLGCFDAGARTVGQSIANHDLVLVNREQLRSTRRSLFGFAIPDGGVFGDEHDELKQLDGSLAATGRNRDGGYIFTLQDGSSWSQNDDRPLALAPRAGDKVVVRRAALGSYTLSVGKMGAVRVLRVR